MLINLRKMLIIIKLNALSGRGDNSRLKEVKGLIRSFKINGMLNDKEKKIYEDILNEIIQSNNNNVANNEFEDFQYNGDVNEER